MRSSNSIVLCAPPLAGSGLGGFRLGGFNFMWVGFCTAQDHVPAAAGLALVGGILHSAGPCACCCAGLHVGGILHSAGPCACSCAGLHVGGILHSAGHCTCCCAELHVGGILHSAGPCACCCWACPCAMQPHGQKPSSSSSQHMLEPNSICSHSLTRVVPRSQLTHRPVFSSTGGKE